MANKSLLEVVEGENAALDRKDLQKTKEALDQVDDESTALVGGTPSLIFFHLLVFRGLRQLVHLAFESLEHLLTLNKWHGGLAVQCTQFNVRQSNHKNHENHESNQPTTGTRRTREAKNQRSRGPRDP